MISDGRLEKIEKAVCSRLNEETTPAKVRVVECACSETLTPHQGRVTCGERQSLRRQGAVSIACRGSDLTDTHQANFNRLLDVARETYKENVGDIYALRNRLVEEHNLPFTLVYRDSDAGFIFSIKKADLDDTGGELPRGFIDATAQKGRWVFSSIELVSGIVSIFRGKST